MTGSIFSQRFDMPEEWRAAILTDGYHGGSGRSRDKNGGGGYPGNGGGTGGYPGNGRGGCGDGGGACGGYGGGNEWGEGGRARTGKVSARRLRMQTLWPMPAKKRGN